MPNSSIYTVPIIVGHIIIKCCILVCQEPSNKFSYTACMALPVLAACIWPFVCSLLTERTPLSRRELLININIVKIITKYTDYYRCMVQVVGLSLSWLLNNPIYTILSIKMSINTAYLA